ncbi:class I SAM-dependent methyltransferase [Chloroflexota bacterium]
MDNPKKIVAEGYDSVTQPYLELIDSMGPRVRDKYLKVITDELPPGARILELGCGAGIPMTRVLSAHYRVIGVDISKEQLLLATRNVTEADFILGDMTRLGFNEAVFDAVAAFYSITHVPRDEHFQLLTDIYRMLKPGGLLVVTMGAGDTPDSIEHGWLGASMFFSHFDGDKNETLLTDAGFHIINATDEDEMEYDQPVRFR